MDNNNTIENTIEESNLKRTKTISNNYYDDQILFHSICEITGRPLLVLKEGVRKLQYPFTREELDQTSDLQLLLKIKGEIHKAKKIIEEDNDWN